MILLYKAKKQCWINFAQTTGTKFCENRKSLRIWQQQHYERFNQKKKKNIMKVNYANDFDVFFLFFFFNFSAFLKVWDNLVSNMWSTAHGRCMQFLMLILWHSKWRLPCFTCLDFSVKNAFCLYKFGGCSRYLIL